MTGPVRASAGAVNVGAAAAGMDRRLRLMRWYRGFIPPGRASPLDLLMIQPTSFCNIDCRYCYLPHRSRKGQFSLDLIEPLFAKLLDAGLIGETLSVLWHAGEPMVLQPAYYADAFDRIARIAGSVSRITHFIQTNGTLISQEWCDLIRAKGIRIGVSIDGPEHIHDANRVTRAGKGTFSEAMRGIDLLKKNGIEFTVIAVVTARSLDHADEIYEFFKKLGGAQTGFNIDEIEGGNAKSSLEGAPMEERYRNFMARLLQRSIEDKSLFRIREFAQAMAHLNGELFGQAAYSTEANAFSILSCDTNGKLFTFSPELVDLSKEGGGDYSIGDVQTIDFARIYQERRFAEMNAEIEAGVAQCRQSCGYFSGCGGGAPANKLGENGTFNSTETLFCRYKSKITPDVVGDHVVKSITNRRVPKVPAASLRRGLSVFTPPGTNLLITGGTGGRELARDIDRYDPLARLPLNAWRELDAEERALLSPLESAAGAWSFVSIVRLPPGVLDPVSKIASALSEASNAVSGVDPSALPVIEEVGTALARMFGEPGRPHRTLGIGVNEPGLETTTVEGPTQLRLGLHVDSWSSLLPADRSEAPNRICVNLGHLPRRLLFINLPLQDIVSSLPTVAMNGPGNGATELARRFMRAFPSYPVLSVEIKPGEAYIAPTESMVHDGCTAHMTSRDVSLTVLGHFTREAR